MTGLRRLADLAGLCIAAGLVWWAYGRVDLRALGDHLRAGDRAWIAASLGVLALCHAARVYRWSTLCASAGSSRFAAAIAGPVGLLSITLLPFRLGEGVRLALQRRLDSSARIGGLAGLTLVERAGDLLGIFVLVAAGAAAAGRFLPAAALAGGLAAATLVVAQAPRLASSHGGRKPIAIAMRIARLLADRKNALPHVAAISVVAWLGDGIAIACLGRAFGSALPLGMATGAAGWVALGVALPTAPAGLGTHQAVMAWALGGAASLEVAIAISLAMTGLVVVVQAALSIVALGVGLTRAAIAVPAAPAPDRTPLPQTSERPSAGGPTS